MAEICVMNNFEDMYSPMNVLGKGSFATVSWFCNRGWKSAGNREIG